MTREPRPDESLEGAAALLFALLFIGLVTGLIGSGEWVLIVPLLLLVGAGALVARRVARRPARNFVEDCCHRVAGVTRAGPGGRQGTG
jgi:F0F1-type ATP synthase assembly protein I